MATYFRILKEANMARDVDTGESAEAFLEVKNVTLKQEDAPSEQILNFKKYIGDIFHIAPEHMEFISEKEYLENVDEEESDL